MSRNFKFKEGNYDLETLYCYHMDKRLNGFEEGEVINSDDGEIFDIKDIKNYRHLLNKNLIKNASHYIWLDDPLKFDESMRYAIDRIKRFIVKRKIDKCY